MLTSSDRIITTHAGSLPRPALLAELHGALDPSDAAAIDEFRRAVEEATHAVIAAQADAGIDVGWGSNQIAHVSDEGEVATINLPAGSEPHGLAIGPDDALWVALESGAVIRIT